MGDETGYVEAKVPNYLNVWLRNLAAARQHGQTERTLQAPHATAYVRLNTPDPAPGDWVTTPPGTVVYYSHDTADGRAVVYFHDGYPMVYDPVKASLRVTVEPEWADDLINELYVH